MVPMSPVGWFGRMSATFDGVLPALNASSALAIDAAAGAPRQLDFFGNFLTWEDFWLGFVQVMPLVIVSYAIGLGIEFLFAVIKGHEVEEGYLVTGMLVPLIV